MLQTIPSGYAIKTGIDYAWVFLQVQFLPVETGGSTTIDSRFSMSDPEQEGSKLEDLIRPLKTIKSQSTRLLFY